MKKIKLIAPILGAAATLGTAIPLAACQEQGTEVEVTGIGEGDVRITSATPTCSAGKNFQATITWKHSAHTDEGVVEYVNTYVDGVRVYAIVKDETGKEKAELIDSANVTSESIDFGKFSVQIAGEFVPSKMRIEFNVKHTDNAVFDIKNGVASTTAENPITGYTGDEQYKNVNGVASDTINNLTTYDTLVAFTMNVAVLEETLNQLAQQTGATIPSLTEQTSLYLYLADKDKNRVDPTSVVGVKLRNTQTSEEIEISGNWNDEVHSLGLSISGQITHEMIATREWQIVGYYTFELSPYTNINGGRFCIFPASELQ